MKDVMKERLNECDLRQFREIRREIVDNETVCVVVDDDDMEK